MKFTYGDILFIFQAAKQENFWEWENMPISLSLKISRFLSTVEQEITVLEKERQKILKKYSELNEDGSVKTDEENNAVLIDRENFIKEYQVILENELELDFTPIPVSLEDLDKKGFSKSPKQLAWLIPLIELND